MDYFDLIRNRESIRDYDPEKPVEKEKLLKILEAGRIAPSAANRQPWKFLLISSPGLLNKVRECYHKPWFQDAPHILVVVGNEEEAWKRNFDGYNSIETDLTIALDHMILAAENEGVGTCWIANYDPFILQEALELKDNERVFSITPLGYQRAGFRKKNLKIRKSADDVYKFL